MNRLLPNRSCTAVMFSLALAVSLIGGCSNGSADGTVAVSGNITFDGQPLSSGKIILEPMEPGGRPYAGSIHDGHFQMYASPGQKVVRITSTRYEAPQGLSKKAKTSMEVGMTQTIPVQFVPKRYNQQSELKIEIDEAGNGDLAWDLKN